MLQAFEIERFRTFRHLRIDRLARVNLIVGRNNVGKTMLLEALRLYADGANPGSLVRLLAERDEFAPPMGPLADAEEGALLQSAALFHGVPRAGAQGSIRLGDPTDPERSLVIFENWDPTVLFSSLGVERFGRTEIIAGSRFRWPASRSMRRGYSPWPPFLSGHGMDATVVGRAWDTLALKAGEERVLRCLQSVAPIERITLIQHPGRGELRIVMARLAGQAEPVPLRRLGDGMMRIFQIALALEMVHHGAWKPEEPAPEDLSIDERVFLVDEIETGIHYSALPEVWSFLLQAAREAGVQVFAATHSWDAIEALQQAVAGEPEGSAMLIRLEQRGDTHRAILFDQSELPLVTKHHVEVR